MPKRCLVLLLFSLPFGLSSLPAKLPVRPIAQGACAAAILGLVAKEHLRVLAARKELNEHHRKSPSPHPRVAPRPGEVRGGQLRGDA
mgnify:CR=1 FL=1